MDANGAEKAILGSAIVVAGVWGYRKMVEPLATAEPGVGTLKAIAGMSSVPASASEFAVAFGFSYLALSLIAEAAPDVAGAFAILIATGSILANGQSLFSDVSGQVGAKKAAGVKVTPAKTSPTVPAKKVG